MKDEEIKLLVYSLFIKLPIEQNHNINTYQLINILKFMKKYFYILNIECQSIIYIDHKSFIRFFNVGYYEDIFAY